MNIKNDVTCLVYEGLSRISYTNLRKDKQLIINQF